MSTSDSTGTARVATATSQRTASGGTARKGGKPAARPSNKKPAAARPGTAKSSPHPSAAPPPGAPRRVRLTVSRVDPWSMMKLAFLLSVAIGIAMVVAAGVLWTVLDGMGVFSDINSVVGQIMGSSAFDINDFVGFGKVLSLATVLAVVNVVLLTALATLGAFLYNIAGSLVGGLHLTLTDD